MKSVSAQEFDDVLDLLYEGPMEAVAWRQALECLRGWFGANHATLFLRATTPQQPGVLVTSGDVETEAINAYHSLYYALDPFVDLPSDRVVTVTEVMDAEEWLGSAYYQQFLSDLDIFHMMGADVRLPGGATCRLRICRARMAPAFTALDKALCEKLLPHLRRSLKLYTHIGRIGYERTLYADTVDRLMVGTITLDEEGRILQVSQAAEKLLAAADGLRRVGDRLQTLSAPCDRQLRRLIDKALASCAQTRPLSGEAMSVARPSGRGSLGIVVQKAPVGDWLEGVDRPAVTIFLRDPEQTLQATCEVARQLFDLTPAEATLAMQLVNGASLEDAAEVMQITRNTAKTHLGRIFSKIGVKRQTELTRMLLNSVMTLGG